MKIKSRVGRRPTLAIAASIVLTGCAAPAPDSPPVVERVAPAVIARPPVSRGLSAQAMTPESPPSAGASPLPSDERTRFATRYAHFEPASWHQLPGWKEDSLAGAWAAFRRSCGVLVRKTGWREICARAVALGTVDDDAVRRFFEREFSLYAIHNVDRTPTGVITGYYEPFLNGRRSRGGEFVYPIYAKPDDLLTLDIRTVPRELRGQPLGARVEGRKVLPVLEGAAPYVLDVGELKSDLRDKKLRVRREGRRIVPYPTRAQIQRDGLANARILAWVDNLAALYSMQIQGSGKVRLSHGQVLRLAYAEQNGHPFTPPGRKNSHSQESSQIATRGLDPESTDHERDADELAWREVWMMPEAAHLTRGGASSRRNGKSTSQVSSDAGEALSPEVEQLIEDLASGREIGEVSSSPPPARTQPPVEPSVISPPTPVPAASQSPPSTVAAQGPTSTATSDVAAAATPMTFPQPSPAMRAAISADPSYVFFREIPDGPEGPIGALGVPLTAGRSVAVDPRTTPLGFPVFVSTGAGKERNLNRLVMAQDTGGAIRGAVRADYFWGFGADAHARAARMKESGRMWVMFPREMQIPAREQAVRTRGTDAVLGAVECVVEDPDLCVED